MAMCGAAGMTMRERTMIMLRTFRGCLWRFLGAMFVAARIFIGRLLLTSGRLDGLSRACPSTAHEVGREWLGIFPLPR